MNAGLHATPISAESLAPKLQFSAHHNRGYLVNVQTEPVFANWCPQRGVYSRQMQTKLNSGDEIDYADLLKTALATVTWYPVFKLIQVCASVPRCRLRQCSAAENGKPWVFDLSIFRVLHSDGDLNISCPRQPL